MLEFRSKMLQVVPIAVVILTIEKAGEYRIKES